MLRDPDQPERAAKNWAGLVGRWEFEDGSATWVGPSELEEKTSPPVSFGLAISDLSFRGGRITATVELTEPSSAGRIVFGRDRAGFQYYSVGIGGQVAYYLDRFEVSRGWNGLAVWGPPENLKGGHPYELTVDVMGQRVVMTVDEVQVLEGFLPGPLEGEQVGVITWTPPGTVFRDVRVSAVRPRAFAVMEFGSPFDAMYEQVIKPVCERLGLTVERADDWRRPGVIMDEIVQAITSADLVIAEITPKNPNVYYEVGYAQARGVPTILLFTRQDDAQIPFDLSGQRAIFYEDTIEGKSTVERDLERHIESVLLRT